MRLSLVFLNAARCGARLFNAARCGAAFFDGPLKRTTKFHYHRRTEVSTSANRRTGARRIGSLIQRRQCPPWGQKQISSGEVDRQARADDARSDESGLHGFVTPFFTTTA
jgi:hypothetical protein